MAQNDLKLITENADGKFEEQTVNLADGEVLARVDGAYSKLRAGTPTKLDAPASNLALNTVQVTGPAICEASDSVADDPKLFFLPAGGVSVDQGSGVDFRVLPAADVDQNIDVAVVLQDTGLSIPAVGELNLSGGWPTIGDGLTPGGQAIPADVSSKIFSTITGAKVAEVYGDIPDNWSAISGADADDGEHIAVLGSSVKHVGSTAFYYLSMDFFTFPPYLESIGDYGFQYSVGKFRPAGHGIMIMPDSLTSIGEYATNDLDLDATVLKLSPNLTSIGNYGMEGFNGLKEVIFESNVASLSFGYSFLSDTSTVESDLTVPASVSSWGDFSFQNWSKAASVHGNLRVENCPAAIGEAAFEAAHFNTGTVLYEGVIGIGFCMDATFDVALTFSAAVTALQEEALQRLTCPVLNMLPPSAPTCDTDVLRDATVGEIHVPVGATGYDVAPWTNFTVIADL